MVTSFATTFTLCLVFNIILTIHGKSVPTRDQQHKHEHNRYSTCPPTKEGFINVHIIPHSHDDVGWLKTVDQYYFGSKTSIQRAGVQYILDSVVQELKRDPEKRFIYVETAFFWKWWNRQTAEVQKDVKDLVNSGRLEFISGGWAMHDEATTHYHSIVDQFTLGFRKLNDTFGSYGVPRVGWQIDPFGHSRETASLMARMGFDGLLLGRIDYQDKVQRMLSKNMEMVWETSPNLGKETDLFTDVLYNTYSAPRGFCFDVLCRDEPIIDDKTSPEYNADRRAKQFLADVANRTLAYNGSNIAVAFGDDFNYQDAQMYFVNIDRLIKAVNARQTTHNSDINLLYSTPSCYLKALNSEGLQFPVKKDDFFPYASDPHAYWTGYFTSRPTLKRFERLGNNLLQVCKQTAALSNLDAESIEGLDNLREAMGVMQHHDAVTGTEKQHVANDYARILSEAIDSCDSVTEAALNKLIKLNVSSPPITLERCPLLNISQCEFTETTKTFVITLYNPLSRPVTHYVRLPVPGNSQLLVVYDPKGQILPLQSVPIPEPVTKIPGRFSQATVELVFQASDVPALGYRSYYVTASNSLLPPEILAEPINNDRPIALGQERLKLIIDSKTGVPNKLEGPELTDYASFQQNFYYFNSAVGNNEIMINRSSGAYIMRPNSSYFMINPQPITKYYKGNVVDEVHQEFSSWVSQVVRYYHTSDYLEFNWLIGPIPVSDEIGKEVVTRYRIFGMDTNRTFYTDSNGREMLQRVLDARPSYNVTIAEPVGGNYYPVTTCISIKDDKVELSVLTDRAEGGTSLNEGEIELMLHRRMLHDDGFGVGEGLNEQAFGRGLVARGTHLLTEGSSAKKTAQAQALAIQAYFTPTTLSLNEWQAFYKMEWSGLKAALPDSVQILTLEPWKDSSFLLRLEHFLEADNNSSGNEPVTVNLQEIFKPFVISWVRETSLGANQWLDELSRLVWKKEDNNIFNSETQPHTKLQELPQVKLFPMDIKTFIIQVSFD